MWRLECGDESGVRRLSAKVRRLVCGNDVWSVMVRVAVARGVWGLECGDMHGLACVYAYHPHRTPHISPTAYRPPPSHTAHRAPHTTHRTPHTAHRAPHTAHRTPHTAHRTPHTAYRTHFNCSLVSFWHIFWLTNLSVLGTYSGRMLSQRRCLRLRSS